MRTLVSVSRPGLARVGKVDPAVEAIWDLVVHLASSEGADNYVIESLDRDGRIQPETGLLLGSLDRLANIGPRVQSLNVYVGEEFIAGISDEGQNISTWLTEAATAELRKAVALTPLQWDEL